MTQRRRVVLLDLVGSTAVIGGALLFQYAGGLQPCELCLIERWPYYVSIPLLLLALASGLRRAMTAAILAMVLLLFLAGSAVAFYHVGVEQHWFAGPAACTSPATAAHTLEALKAQLMNQQPVRCDVVQWSLVGVSLAGWNLIASLALAGLSLSALRARGGRRRR